MADEAGDFEFDPIKARERKQASVNRWNLMIQVLLGIIAVVFLVLFIVFAVANGNGRSCSLVYNEETSKIKPSELDGWASKVGWTITHPKHVAGAGCSCDDSKDDVLNPVTAGASHTTPVWIGPCDLYALYSKDRSVQFPSDFLAHVNDCSTDSMIKVCLPNDKLDTLWTGKHEKDKKSFMPKHELHCHDETGLLTKAVKIFTGYDGDLYCAGNGKEKVSHTVEKADTGGSSSSTSGIGGLIDNVEDAAKKII
jgi:hypothetical protein